ncbi:MAG TPA: hypothetical protein VIK57_07490 [Streptosporangiaceae bacterium]
MSGHAAAAAEIYLRLIAEAELRQRPVLSGPGPHLHRVWLAAATLAAVGAVSPDVAGQVVSEFEASAGLRSRNIGPVISSLRRPSWARTGARPHHARQYGSAAVGARQPPTRPEAGGPDVPTAVQVGARLPLPAEREGWYGEFCLLSLARTGSQAALAVAARWAGQTRRAAGPRPRHAPHYEVGAVDDRGVSYQTSLWDVGLEDGRDWWDCHLGLDPAPAPGTRWLEVGPGSQGRRVRIDLTAPPGTVRVVTEPIPPVSAATRLLDQAGDDLLGIESATTGASAQLAGRVRQVIRDLIGSGTLRADDPAVLRLAGLGWRLGLDLGLGGPVPARALPAAWISLLADGHAHDGRDAVAPFAADLPVIGGARLALAGLRSAPDGATLHVMASGWEPEGHGWLERGTGPGDSPLDLSLSWRARDSTGRWHLVTGMSRGPAAQTRGMIKMYLTPPLHPAATALDVIVTGPDRQIRATVPLGRAADGSWPGWPPRAPVPPGLPTAPDPGQ